MPSKFVGKGSEGQYFLKDIHGSGRLVEVFAALNQQTLAITYKVDGRKVSRIDSMQNQARDIRRLRATFHMIEQRADLGDHFLLNGEKRALKTMLDQAKEITTLAEERRMGTGANEEISNEPIAKCIYPEGVESSNKGVWKVYKAWCDDNTGSLTVQAKTAPVSAVDWLTSELIQLTFFGFPPKVFVTPLRPILVTQRADEVQVNDIASLLGQYVAIGAFQDERVLPNIVPNMMNQSRIVSMEEQNESRRWRNQ